DLRERDELDGGEWKFCEGRPPGHERFGTCQQGLAAAFSPDRRYVLLGAPGTYNWKGEGRWEPPGAGWGSVPRAPGGDSRVPVSPGFSVDSGAGLTRRHQLSFVTGAPRANHTGAVVILRRDSASRLVA
ncbi:ITA7 protein, partial [Motacilla alba]|nr:ITA7 protein [Motacilla alba]